MILEYVNNKFNECKAPKDTNISLNVDMAQKKLILNVPPTVTMIEKLAAERNARGISKSGFRCSSGATIGRGYELVVEGSGGGLPDRLNRSPREVY